jgi:CRP-like cAMP-binding protein
MGAGPLRGMGASPFENSILRRLDACAVERLELKPVEFERGRNLETAGQEIRQLVFLATGLGLMTASFPDGAQVEVGLFGWEAVIGAPVLMGTRRSLNNISIQIPGQGYVCAVEAGELEFRRFERFHDLVLRYTQAQLVQSAQSAACNARHTLQQRLSRWLLLCRDRTNSDELALTQDCVATMLGVERPAVSIAESKLQELGLLQSRRGRVRILDREGLETTACECYRIVRDHLDSYMEMGGQSAA